MILPKIFIAGIEYELVPKQSKTKQPLENKDWEITAFKAVAKAYEHIYRKNDDGRFWLGLNPNHFSEETCLNKVAGTRHFSEEIWSIHSVCRLSDNMVWTVSEKFSNNGGGIYSEEHIKRFEIKDGELRVHTVEGGGHYLLEHLNKIKQPLFTTEDNVPIYEGGEYWQVWGEKFNVCGNYANKDSGQMSDTKYFSTEAAAKEYVLKAKPVLSLSDVLNCSSEIDFGRQIHMDKLKELVKKRI